MMMLYDSLEGDSKKWVSILPPNSIDSIANFCIILLDMWIEKISLQQ